MKTTASLHETPPECPEAKKDCTVYIDDSTARPHQWCCTKHGVIIVVRMGSVYTAQLAPF